MRKTFYTLFLCSFFSVSFSQALPDTSRTVARYCMVKAGERFLSKKVNIEVDYGQEQMFFDLENPDAIKDESGKLKAFNSIVDALNYMSDQGWKLVDTFVITEDADSGSPTEYQFLMKKNIPRSAFRE